MSLLGNVARNRGSLLWQVASSRFGRLHLSSVSKATQPSLKPLFQKQGAWKDLAALVSELENNIVYYDPDVDPHGLVALNKPYGLGLVSKEKSEYSLKCAIPLLQQRLDVKELYIIKAPEKYSSGIVLLGTSKETEEHVKKCRRRAKAERYLNENYLTVTNSFPRMDKVMDVVDVLMKEVDSRKPVFGKKTLEPVLTRSLHSKTFLKKGIEGVKRVYVYSEIVSKSAVEKAALVSVHPSTTSHNLIPVYLSDLLSPMIGDSLFSYRARRIMGVMTRISHKQSPLTQKQTLPDWMLERLGLQKGEEFVIPKMNHLARFFLHGYFNAKSKNHLTIYAPPPKYFMETLKRLEIPLDLSKVYDEDKVINILQAKAETSENHKKAQNRVERTHIGTGSC